MTYAIEATGLQDIVAAIRELKEKNVGFDEAVLLLINAHGLTWNRAADTIRGAEMLAGIKLER
jgi:hypothetical protein